MRNENGYKNKNKKELKIRWKWGKFRMLHTTNGEVFVLAKLNAKWGGMIKSLVARVESLDGGGSQFIWLCNLAKGLVGYHSPLQKTKEKGS